MSIEERVWSVYYLINNRFENKLYCSFSNWQFIGNPKTESINNQSTTKKNNSNTSRLLFITEGHKDKVEVIQLVLINPTNCSSSHFICTSVFIRPFAATAATIQCATVRVSILFKPCRTRLLSFFWVCVCNTAPLWVVCRGMGVENVRKHEWELQDQPRNS